MPSHRWKKLTIFVTLSVAGGVACQWLGGRFKPGLFTAEHPLPAPFAAIDWYVLVVVGCALFLEAVAAGWQESSARRLTVTADESTTTDILYLVLWATGMLSVLTAVMTLGLATIIAERFTTLSGLRLFQDAPLWIAAPSALVWLTFTSYWDHRLIHTRWLWPLHKAHHAPSAFTMINAFRTHPLEVFYGMISNGLAFGILGFPSEAILLTQLIAGIIPLYLHSNAYGLRWLEQYGVTTPNGHRIHHGVDQRYHNANFGSVLNIWDRAFGTYVFPSATSEALQIGVDDSATHHNTERPFHGIAMQTLVWLRVIRQDVIRIVLRVRAAAPMLCVSLMLLGAGMGQALSQAAAPRDVAVEGTTFRITLTDGTVMPQAALPGIVLTIGAGAGQQRHIRIDAVEPDKTDPAGEVMLYTLSEQMGEGSEWHNICQPAADGSRVGFPLSGAFTKDMRHVDVPGRFLITCTGGAEGKCIRFGYRPWRTAPDGTSLAAYYQACVRMVRADYCGDGVGHTRNGTPIDLFDRVGIQADEPAQGMTLEAAWGPDGAVCVNHTRLSEVLSTEALNAMCPTHVAQRCDEHVPALLYDRSFGR